MMADNEMNKEKKLKEQKKILEKGEQKTKAILDLLKSKLIKK